MVHLSHLSTRSDDFDLPTLCIVNEPIIVPFLLNMIQVNVQLLLLLNKAMAFNDNNDTKMNGIMSKFSCHFLLFILT